MEQRTREHISVRAWKTQLYPKNKQQFTEQKKERWRRSRKREYRKGNARSDCFYLFHALFPWNRFSTVIRVHFVVLSLSSFDFTSLCSIVYPFCSSFWFDRGSLFHFLSPYRIFSMCAYFCVCVPYVLFSIDTEYIYRVTNWICLTLGKNWCHVGKPHQ